MLYSFPFLLHDLSPHNTGNFSNGFFIGTHIDRNPISSCLNHYISICMLNLKILLSDQEINDAWNTLVVSLFQCHIVDLMQGTINPPLVDDEEMMK
jgi:hypothetical protein